MVNVQPVFTSVTTAAFSGYGMQPMNASTAVEYLGFTDIIFGSKFSAFVDGPSRSIDLTPEPFRSTVCGANALALHDKAGCRREYFVPGDAMFIMPEVNSDTRYPQASILLATNHRGLVLRFKVGDSEREFADKDCRVYSGRYWGFQVGAVHMCVVNTAPDELHARMFPCFFSLFSAPVLFLFSASVKG